MKTRLHHLSPLFLREHGDSRHSRGVCVLSDSPSTPTCGCYDRDFLSGGRRVTPGVVLPAEKQAATSSSGGPTGRITAHMLDRKALSAPVTAFGPETSARPAMIHALDNPVLSITLRTWNLAADILAARRNDLCVMLAGRRVVPASKASARAGIRFQSDPSRPYYSQRQSSGCRDRHDHKSRLRSQPHGIDRCLRLLVFPGLAARSVPRPC
jgi:hypothetical protein